MLKQYLELPRTVHILCVGALINRAGAFLVPFLTLYLQEKLNLGVGFATKAMGVYGVGSLVAFLVGGDLADRLGRRTGIVTSLFGAAAVLVVFGSLTSPWSIMVALVIFSLVSEMYRPAASAMIADVTDPAVRPQAYGLMYVAINLGFAVAAMVGGHLAQYSFQWLFWGDALTAAAFGVLVLLAIPETLPSRSGKSNPLEKPSEADLSKEGEPSSVTLADAAKHILTDWTFLIYWLGTFCLVVMYMQAFSTFPLHLGKLGHGSATYGKVIALNGFLIVLFQLPITSLVTRFRRGKMVILSAVITAVGFGLMGLAGAPWHFALTVVIWTCGEMMNAPLMSAIVADLAPQHLRARYMGAFSMCFSAALIIGAPLGGYILERFGGTYLWGGSAVVGLAAACLYTLVRNRVNPRQEPPADA